MGHLTRAAFAACALAWLAACAAPVADATAAMTAAMDASAAAWNRGDLKGHLAIDDPWVTVMTKDGPRAGVAAVEAAFGRTYFDAAGRPKQRLRFERATVRMLGADAALMTGRFVLEGGGLPEQSGWFTLVWTKTAAGWRVVHDHTS